MAGQPSTCLPSTRADAANMRLKMRLAGLPPEISAAFRAPPPLRHLKMIMEDALAAPAKTRTAAADAQAAAVPLAALVPSTVTSSSGVHLAISAPAREDAAAYRDDYLLRAQHWPVA